MAPTARQPADLAGHWFTVLWGVGAVIVGLLLVSRPALTAFFLVQVMALLWLIGGVLDLLSVLFNRVGEHRVWRLVGGVVAILAGLVLLGNPFVGTVLVVAIQFYLIALAAIANGVINIVGRLQGISGWGRFVLGVVEVIIGVFFLLNPLPGLRDFVPVFGLIVAVGGLLTIGAALLSRRGPDRAAQPA
ncbi:MAG: DUF308 domain-containing protein [Chloroflexi bacterium]|nr:DUF308 domain-containing protein [Chloroflexota bacterium]